MRKEIMSFLTVLTVLFVSISLFGRMTTGNDPITTQSTSSASYNTQNRVSSYVPQNQAFAPYSNVTMSNQQTSSSNASLTENTLNFNLSTSTIQTSFILSPNEAFVAIDGASQSLTMRVNFSIYYPNNSLAAIPYMTLASSPMHFFAANPPSGSWRIVATLLDPGETTCWLQAVSYNNGTKLVNTIEKEQINLVSGQSLYYKIPLAPSDWFYLYADRVSGANVQTNLRRNGTYNVLYRNYGSSTASELFSSKSNPNGTYLLQVASQGSPNTDVFIEIIKALGVNLQLNVNSGNLVNPIFRYDLEFLKSTLAQSYEWIAFDGAVADSGSGQTARFLVIDPSLNVVFDGTSDNPHDFQGKMIANNSIGTYYVGIFTAEYANANIKITSSSDIPSIGFDKVDQNVTFSQSGQPYYLKIPQNQIYFLFAGYTYGPTYGIKYSIITPSLSYAWTTQPYNSYTLFSPTVPSVSFYILKLQGQKDARSLIHMRFQGFEDYNIQTPDSSNYLSRFEGDLIVSNVIMRNSDYIFQHSGAMKGNSYVALFDTTYSQKTSISFSSSRQTDFDAWRKGYENPAAGNWLQIFIDTGVATALAGVEISTLQTGDETQFTETPFQFNVTVAWNNWWRADIYKVNVDSPNWFGIVSKLFPVNSSYSYHPYLSGWIYDSSLAAVQSGQIVYSSNTLGNSFWQNPKQGAWIVVLVGFQQSFAYDPLRCLVSFVGDADFRRDWPVNLSGSNYMLDVSVDSIVYTMTAFSNSTISNFSFNQENEEISLVASGPQGNNGFCMVTIPKQISDRPFAVLVDGQIVSNSLSKENSTHTTIYFPYEGATHQITLNPTPPSTQPSSPSPPPTPTAFPSPTPTPTSTLTPTPTPSPTPTLTPPPTPSAISTLSPSPSELPTPTPAPTAMPSPSPTTNPLVSPTPTTTPTPTAPIPELPSWIILPLILATAGLLIILRKRLRMPKNL